MILHVIRRRYQLPAYLRPSFESSAGAQEIGSGEDDHYGRASTSTDVLGQDACLRPRKRMCCEHTKAIYEDYGSQLWQLSLPHLLHHTARPQSGIF